MAYAEHVATGRKSPDGCPAAEAQVDARMGTQRRCPGRVWQVFGYKQASARRGPIQLRERRRSLQQITPCQHPRSIAEHHESVGVFVGDEAIKGMRDIQIVLARKYYLDVVAFTFA